VVKGVVLLIVFAVEVAGWRKSCPLVFYWSP